jgi:5-formyltetrahydrofolate cyclo-ligase
LIERKAAARLRAREARKAIPMPARRAKEQRIRAAVRALPEVEPARLVGCYVGVRSEVDTRVLLEELLAAGKRVAVPVVLPPGTMRLAEVRSLGGLVEGAHRIPEPPAPRAFVDQADALLVPGLLFTPRGERLGNGGGYFDRLLRSMPNAARIGLAYDEQVVDALPIEAHDERMDVVVTDARALRPASPRKR